MIPTAEFWWKLIGLLSLEGAVIVGVAALLSRLTRPVFWQRTIWQVALVALLLVFTGELAGLGATVMRWMGAVKQPASTRQIVVKTFDPDRALVGAAAVSEAAVSGMENPPVIRKESQAGTAGAHWWPIFVWSGGFGWLVIRSLLGKVVFQWRLRPVPVDSDLAARVTDIATRLKLKRRINLFKAEGLTGPVATGIIRPAILIPQNFTTAFNPTQQEAMLAHELGHLAAGDVAWRWVADLVRACWWWHPCAWWSRRQLMAASEANADEASLVVENGPDALAESLVILGRHLVQGGGWGWVGVEGDGFRSGLGKRVTRLLSLEGAVTRKAGLGGLCLAYGIGLLLSGGVVAAGAAWGRSVNHPATAGGRWNSSLGSMVVQAMVAPPQARVSETAIPVSAQAPPTPERERGNKADPPVLLTRTFKVDPGTFSHSLNELMKQKRGAGQETNASGVAQEKKKESAEFTIDQFVAVLGVMGVDVVPPKAVFFNKFSGQLMVRATTADMQIIEEVIQMANTAPPQLTIEVQYAEIDEDDVLNVDIGLALAPMHPTAPAPLNRSQTPRELMQLNPAQPAPRMPANGGSTHLPTSPITGILMPTQYRQIMQALRRRTGVDLVSSPRITTISGRQAQIKIVDVRYVVTDMDRGGTNHSSAPQPISEPFECGPVLDVVPFVAADGKTINMTIIPTVREFLGYDSDGARQIQQAGGVIDPLPLPIFRVRQVCTSAVVRDGQTVVLSPGAVLVEDKSAASNGGPAKKIKKTLLIFVTPTLIDAAGNRIHPES